MEKVIDEQSQMELTEAEKMALQYQDYSVASNEALLTADSDLTLIKQKIKQLDTDRKKATKPMDEAKKVIMELYKKPIERLEQARAIINNAMTSYRREQEKIRQEQERKAQELARKEEERQKKILAEKIKRAEASGKSEKVEALKEQKAEVFVPAPVVQSTVVETKNKPKKIWKYRVKDISLVPREYLIIDNIKVGQVTKATKGTLTIPGIEMYSEDSKF